MQRSSSLRASSYFPCIRNDVASPAAAAAVAASSLPYSAVREAYVRLGSISDYHLEALYSFAWVVFLIKGAHDDTI